MTTYDLTGERVLLGQIAKGSESAFRQVFDRYKSNVYTFILGFTHSKADAEEILQETFLALWQSRHHLDQIEHPRNYIYTIVRNKTFYYLKQVSKSESRMREVWTNIRQDSNSTDDLVHLRDSNRLIQDAIARLSQQKQRVFRMSRDEGLSHEQIARKTGLSKSRVKNIIVEVLQFIRLCLKQGAGAIGILCWFIEK